MIKFTAIIMLAGCLQLSAGTYAQTITLSERNAELKDILVDIYNQAGYYYFGNSELLNKAKKIDIDVKNASLKQVLDICFQGQPLVYTIDDKTILISEKQELLSPPLLPVDMKGKVVDEKGEPLSGATITVKGTTHSVQAGPDGEFILPVPAENAVLVISNIGYETVEIKTGNNHFQLVHMALSMSKLDEVQIIAYGTTTRRLSTSEVNTLKSGTIEQQPVANPLEAMEARIPGVYIQQETGLPGGGINIQIRGQNSLRNALGNNGNLPLYVVDGVPFTASSLSSQDVSFVTQYGNPLNSINPSDIESIEILKDGDATAIYGSRGANGVVMITTKKGKTGSTKLDVNVSHGIGELAHKMKLLDTKEYLQMRNEAFANDGRAPQTYNAPDLLLWDTTRNTDWQKVLIGNHSQLTNAQGDISGGNKNTQFFIGGGYRGETTVFPGDFADRKISGHLSINHLSEDEKFSSRVSVSYVNDQNDLPGVDLTDLATKLAPDAPRLYDSAGKLNWMNSTWTNPLSYIQGRYTSNTENLLANVNLGYKIIPRLQLLLSMGYNSIHENEISTNPLSAVDPAYYVYSTPTANFANSSLKTWIIEPQAKYDQFTKIGMFSALLGATFQQNIFQSQSLTGSGYTNDNLLQDIQAAASVFANSANYTQYKYNGVFGRINYNYASRYLLNLTFRRDGSSRFGPGKQFANFGAVGAGWIWSSEKFIRDNFHGISFGKLRGSYGVTGNDQIPDYGFIDSYSSTIYPYNNTPGLIPSRIANPAYSWEINKKLEAGLELGFLKDRVNLVADWYRNRSSNQLVGYSLAPTTGFSSVQFNLPALVQNTGWEFEINTVNIKTGSLKYTTGINLTIPQNKLISYPNIAGSSYANIYVVGYSLYVKNRYHNTGVDPQTGVYTFEDVNKDGKITNPEDLLPLKEVAQNYYGGFLNTVSYKNLQLDIFLQFVNQSAINYLQFFSMAGAFNSTGRVGNQPEYVLDRWQQPGDHTGTQKFSENYGSATAVAYFRSLSGDNSISDASFVRLKNVALSYQCPGNWLTKMHVRNCKLFLQGQNLVTFTRYKGLDPETESSSVLPPLRKLVIGIQVTL